MKNLIAVTLLVGAVGIGGCGRFGGAPKTEEDKTLYALGMIIGRNLGDFNLTPRELDVVKAGMTDMVQKKKTAVELETWAPRSMRFTRRAGRRAARSRRSRARRPSRTRRASRARCDAGGRDRPHREAGDRRDAAADRQGQGPLHREAARRHRVRYLAQAAAKPVGVSAQRRDQVLGRGGGAHEGRRAGGAHLSRRTPPTARAASATSRRARRWCSTSSCVGIEK